MVESLRAIYSKMLNDLLFVFVNDYTNFGEAALRLVKFEEVLKENGIKFKRKLSKTAKKNFDLAVKRTREALASGDQIIDQNALNAFIREKKFAIDKRLKMNMVTMKQSFKQITELNSYLGKHREGGLFQVARRIKDDIRKIGLKNIERKIITGEAWNKTEQSIFNDLEALARGKKIITGEKIGKKINIKAFEKISDIKNGYFKLRVKTGHLRWYNIKDYANLVATTTSTEASTLGTLETNKAYKNYLVSYNYIGKNYILTGDPCYKIDGQILSTKKGYIAENGKKYPYFHDVLGKYNTPHPLCRHRLGGVLESRLSKYEEIAKKNKHGIKAT